MAVRLRVTISWPRRQVIITIEITSATTSGSHAPCSTLAMLAEKNDTSTVKNRTTIGTSLRFGVPQSSRATAAKSTVLRMNVPVTATP